MMIKNERLLVFLRAPDAAVPRAGTASPPRYQWRCNQIDLPCTDQCCVLLESTTRAHADNVYSVLIDDGGTCVVRPPAVLAALCIASDPPWRWPELAVELRGQPDLFATLFTVFRELVQQPLVRNA